ncbi:Gag-pol fusion polyprotein [Elysia marginata]|uniref:Gag-pol fusion polyprotein n=1 Tax=Elysia marginata TaxID=1093978 RepID=A0AAV4EFS6_9GAST|nr:Gag-pol fusion polyprotein [Elysia marginata]
MGEVWERQIRTVRSVLNGLLGRSGQRLSTSSLRALFYEVMAIVNSRPLTVESLEMPDSPRPLTPNHLLTMKSSVPLPPPGVFEEAELYIRKRWRCVQRLADEFWRAWKGEYLATLQPRPKWQNPQRNIAVDDVVILHDDNVCRNEWKLARVVEAVPSADGLVRSAKIMMSSSFLDGQGCPLSPSVFLFRPVHKLTVLVRANQLD